ncbi:MAG: hypothetical protein FD174_1356 [Geobacteraceae bacterium]|nr:MAG: hypothetical protein FD174_1356 [Geobacteraceae bacterium]
MKTKDILLVDDDIMYLNLLSGADVLRGYNKNQLVVSK